MSHSTGEVILGDQVAAYFLYDGTRDVAYASLWDTSDEAWDNARDNVDRKCVCGAAPDAVLLYSEYGDGFYWPAEACLSCRVIVSNRCPYNLPDGVEQFDGDPLIRATSDRGRAKQLTLMAKRGDIFYCDDESRFYFRDIAFSESLLQEALTIYEGLPDLTYIDYVETIFLCADLAQQKGEYAEAENLIRRITHWIEYDDGMKRLAKLCILQERFQEAEVLLLEALSQVEEGEYSWDYVRPREIRRVLIILGDLYYRMGHLEDSENIYRRALASGLPKYEAVRSEYGVHAHLTHLAVVFYETGRYEEAEGIYRTLLKLLPENNDMYPAEQIERGAELFSLLHRLGEPSHGEPFWLLERFCGGPPKGDYPYLAVLLNNLANLRALAGSYSEAVGLYERAIENLIEKMTPDHPSIGIVRENLARVSNGR